MSLNLELQKTVQYLYGKGVIKKDKDVADETGYNKATVSSYLSGRKKASEDFIIAFEKAFNIKIADYKTFTEVGAIKQSNPLQTITERLLQVHAATRVNQSLLVELLSHASGKTVMELSRVVSSAMDDELKQLMDELKRNGG